MKFRWRHQIGSDGTRTEQILNFEITLYNCSCYWGKFFDVVLFSYKYNINFLKRWICIDKYTNHSVYRVQSHVYQLTKTSPVQHRYGAEIKQLNIAYCLKLPLWVLKTLNHQVKNWKMLLWRTVYAGCWTQWKPKGKPYPNCREKWEKRTQNWRKRGVKSRHWRKGLANRNNNLPNTPSLSIIYIFMISTYHCWVMY